LIQTGNTLKLARSKSWIFKNYTKMFQYFEIYHVCLTIFLTIWLNSLIFVWLPDKLNAITIKYFSLRIFQNFTLDSLTPFKAKCFTFLNYSSFLNIRRNYVNFYKPMSNCLDKVFLDVPRCVPIKLSKQYEMKLQ